ncbi:hypothetical protein OG455_16775 [Kitasatospora sp. NBC_01287]|uniref:TolB family protein n=1 Tax=Kitasatospora sp. NBC_01287 TaxID=2903573 RepID=UPI00225703C2|nr:hypothetical protein [Kitasatospora sp. NBC_01287]MCX4747153.1 hypothetical protein [Kitasatospora sp. NBC_01287]
MSARHRRRPATTVALAAALSAGVVLLISACGPDEVGATGSTAGSPTAAAPRSTAPTAPAAPGKPSGKPTAPAGTPAAAKSSPPASGAPGTAGRGTANSPLTVSDGTSEVLMNGTSVDFHTQVRDLAWSSSGDQAAFVNSAGDLVVSKPDGSAQRVVAKNPGGQTWSHPTWQQSAADPGIGLPVRNNLFFTVDQAGTTHLAEVSATATDATPTTLSLNAELTDPPTTLPQTGNLWPDVAGPHGTAVYANGADGHVYIRDEYTRQQGGVLTVGSEPALAPDESAVAFVSSANGHDHLFVLSLQSQGATPKDLTPNATTDYTEPAWSPDSKTIAVRTPDGVATVPANGQGAPKLTVTTPGLPAYRP